MTPKTAAWLQQAANRPERNSYDPETPDALRQFMLRDWAPPGGGSEQPLADAAAFAARRRRLSAAYPGETLVVPTGGERVRANDTYYRFRPGSDFYYLTGNLEPDCVLVLEPAAGGHRDVLYVEPNVGKTHESFFERPQKGRTVGRPAARRRAQPRALRRRRGARTARTAGVAGAAGARGFGLPRRPRHRSRARRAPGGSGRARRRGRDHAGGDAACSRTPSRCANSKRRWR